jgi:hypothetical protein
LFGLRFSLVLRRVVHALSEPLGRHPQRLRQPHEGRGAGLIAGRWDYKVAARLLAGPMNRQLRDGPSEPARRFARRLAGWFDTGTVTIGAAKAEETMSKRSVYGWFPESLSSRIWIRP